MAKINLDTLFPPIEICCDGHNFVISKITDDMLTQCAQIGEKETNRAKSIYKQFAVFVNKPCEEIEALHLDVVKVTSALRYITKCVVQGLEVLPETEKN